jgi:hypothetical protein
MALNEMFVIRYMIDNQNDDIIGALGRSFVHSMKGIKFTRTREGK